MYNTENSLLTEFGKKMLQDRYLLPGESYNDVFLRVASYYADDNDHAQRLYSYMSKLWFMPATPILSNGGTDKGLPISCFLNEVQDSMVSIDKTYSENIFLASSGGGIGSYWGNVRSIGEVIKNKGTSSGIMPFVKVMDSMAIAISQGSVRRGSAAVYLQDTHPEIEEFVDLRRPIGDSNRRSLNLHHGIAISDAFMIAVEGGEKWSLKSPVDGKVVRTINARDLWIKILTARVETGEPYLLFIDNVNKGIPLHHKKLGLNVKTSNLCSEITLPTGIDHLGHERTAVCCLSSLNLEYYLDWEQDNNFIEDIIRFLDNVLDDFINKAPDGMQRAKYSAMRERSVGLGVMGFHSFLQSQMVPFEGVMAKSWNKRIFSHIKKQCDEISIKLAKIKGACPDAKDCNIEERFSNKIAIAPTASISNICGESSPGIEPYAANVFTQKTLSGSFVVKNKNLKKLLQQKHKDNQDIWSSISTNDGSVQHIDFLSAEEKAVFKTSFEINQAWVIEHVADRTPFICQSQSVNLFFLGNVAKSTLHTIHFDAWKKGVKSLYYCRSRSIQRADKVSNPIINSTIKINLNKPKIPQTSDLPYESSEECLSCQ
jgi:ribonucleoside-diphosphate reductase alpha chain